MRLIRYATPLLRDTTTARLVRSPWTGLEAEMDRLFAAALDDPAPDRFPVDLYEDANATYVRAELPGVARSDLGVELADGVLHLTARRSRPAASGRDETIEYSRAITVPEGAVQADKISAVYENGVLTVTLPKREESKPRKITVADA